MKAKKGVYIAFSKMVTLANHFHKKELSKLHSSKIRNLLDLKSDVNRNFDKDV